MEYVIESPVYQERPDIQVLGVEGNPLPVESITLENGKITQVTLTSGEILDQAEFSVNQEFLYVPGIGYLPPGIVVRYHNEDYMLLFGWHVNISNQNIYSWFLSPMNHRSPREPINKTLYLDMIDEIDMINYPKNFS